MLKQEKLTRLLQFLVEGVKSLTLAHNRYDNWRHLTKLLPFITFKMNEWKLLLLQ